MLAGVVIAGMTYFPIVFVLSNSLKSGRGIFSSGVSSQETTGIGYGGAALAHSATALPVAASTASAAASISARAG